MSGLLLNFRNTVIASVILALLVVFGFAHVHGSMDLQFWEAVLRWLHVFSGILWIGLLYYFNFVQTRKMPDIPAELKPAISKYITPEALFWFRWSALFTFVFGLAIAGLRDRFDQPGYLANTLSFDFSDHFQSPQYALMGLGMWLATIMFLNVWGVIWPNQKVALGIVEADADKKAKAAKVATLASRVNMLLSIPMLVSMTMYQTLNG
jgi:uncharacterized membrane protein